MSNEEKRNTSKPILSKPAPSAPATVDHAPNADSAPVPIPVILADHLPLDWSKNKGGKEAGAPDSEYPGKYNEARDKAEAERAAKAKAKAEADRAAEERGKELDAKFGNPNKVDSRDASRQRMKEIKEFLQECLKGEKKNKEDLDDFAEALASKRVDLPNKFLLTSNEFNDFMNELCEIKDGQNPAPNPDPLPYIIEKIRSDSIG